MAPTWSQYSAAHRKVSLLRGRPALCEECGSSNIEARYEWANLTGDFGNPSDYKRLCVPCHRKFDDGDTPRGGSSKGASNGRAKLTEEQVREIRLRHEYVKGPNSNPNSSGALAREFNVSAHLIWLIVKGRAWSHI